MLSTKLMFTSRTVLIRNGFCRAMSQVNKSLVFSGHGEPLQVLEMECDNDVKCPKNNEVLVKMIAAPLHPVDVCVIRGEYPLLPCLPGVGGHEGFGKIVSVGDKVKKLCPGDRVVFNQMGIGTWRSYGLFRPDILYPISNKICLPEAATFVINPSIAYRMLKDFVKLKSGDTVIQNCANSGVGQAVHQLSKIWKYKSIGIIRNGEDANEIKKYLKSIGAYEVLTEDEFVETKIFDKKFKKPKLGLNCIGGESAQNIVCRLESEGVLVTYGNLSCTPFPTNSDAMIYRKICYCGFWLHKWLLMNKNSKEQRNMFKALHSLYEKGKLKAPLHEIVEFDDYKNAEENFKLSPCYGKKTIFQIDKDCQ